MEDIIIHPRQSKREQRVPPCGLMLVTPPELQYGHRRLTASGGRNQFIFGSNLVISADKTRFAAGPAVGAPVAAMLMEKLIVLGARRIIMFGWCGVIDRGLQVGDVIVGGSPESGEGTSRYYPTPTPPLPSSSLQAGLVGSLAERGIASVVKNVWSTDALYREDRKYLNRLHREAGVCCVDMEYSALCAVAAFRGVEFAALLLASDELYRQQWVAGYTREDFLQKSRTLVDLLLDDRVFRGE
ncbi:MAG: nucleoside phosphorylase [Desulfopila sp.]